MDCINSLKKRAKEMIEGNNEREIGPEEIYNIICEWAESCALNEKLNKELREDKIKRDKIMAELNHCRESVNGFRGVPDNNDGTDIRLILAEMRDTLRRLEHEQKIKEIDQRYTEWENKKKNAEWEMEAAKEQKAHMLSEYWNRRG